MVGRCGAPRRARQVAARRTAISSTRMPRNWARCETGCGRDASLNMFSIHSSGVRLDRATQQDRVLALGRSGGDRAGVRRLVASRSRPGTALKGSGLLRRGHPIPPSSPSPRDRTEQAVHEGAVADHLVQHQLPDLAGGGGGVAAYHLPGRTGRPRLRGRRPVRAPRGPCGRERQRQRRLSERRHPLRGARLGARARLRRYVELTASG